MKILAIGLGYCAQHFLKTRGLQNSALGTARSASRRAALTQAGFRAALFDGVDCDPQVREAAQACDALIVSAPPDEAGDPTLRALEPDLRANPTPPRILYLSTIGVYGDCAGAWIDEEAPLRPLSPRGERRAAAEAAWLEFGRATGARVFVLRLAGIYGPGRSALNAVEAGTARRIIKPGQVFNRIHVEDVARAIEACLATSEAGGVFNISDDEPSAPGDPISFAAKLLGAAEPPEIAFENADLTPMARSFWGECKRTSNQRLKERLGVRLAYPDYRQGLRALFESGWSK